MDQLKDERAVQLFRLISASDKKAFDELFRKSYASLVVFCCRYVKDKQTASDIVQDTFIKLWNNRSSLAEVGLAKSYLYRIVRNLSLNYIRDNANTQTGLELITDEAILEGEGQLGWSDPVESDTSNNVQTRMALVKRWIGQLPERQKEAFELSRFEGLDHHEIAEVMNVSARTVNNHIVEALKNIQKIREMDAKRNVMAGHG
ncbi:MAG: RNA polymerase sigma-70 factor [Balneolia bacterium]|nr:RNA polymerase sigma-70 factor [Balneolia bacterium]